MIVSNCRACSASIGFIQMTSGRTMPVDVGLVKTYGVDANRLLPDAASRSTDVWYGKVIVLVTERGEMVRFRECDMTVPGAKAYEGYTNHWSTCTDPARFRS